MKISNIKIKNFTTYKNLSLDLTDQLLLVGNNGHGKSSIPKSICWAFYGQVPDGSSPENGDCKVEINFEVAGKQFQVTRRKNSGKTDLKFSCDSNDLTGQTTTKTQSTLESVVGSWQQFTSTRLFVKEFLTKFGYSTDKEKKSLLEAIIGLGQFSKALELVRVDKAEKIKLKTQLSYQAQSKENIIDSLESRLGKLDKCRPAKVIKKELDSLNTKQRSLNKLYVDLAPRENLLYGEFNKVDRTLRYLTDTVIFLKDTKEATIAKKSKALVDSSSCPTCGQTLEKDSQVMSTHFDNEIAKLDSEIAELLKQKQLIIPDHKIIHLASTACKQAIDIYRNESSETARRITPLTGELATAESVGKERDYLEEEISNHKLDISITKEKIATLDKELKVLDYLEEVYGLTGARTLALQDSLTQLEADSNEILGELGLEAALTISGQATQKSGKEVDKVSIQVEGAGGGDYKALSTGERSRVDVALLLALAKLQKAEGLLIFDEIFDALDPMAVESVANYFQKLAQTNQLIILSHNPELISLIPRGQVRKAIKINGESNLEVIRG